MPNGEKDKWPDWRFDYKQYINDTIRKRCHQVVLFANDLANYSIGYARSASNNTEIWNHASFEGNQKVKPGNRKIGEKLQVHFINRNVSVFRA